VRLLIFAVLVAIVVSLGTALFISRAAARSIAQAGGAR